MERRAKQVGYVRKITAFKTKKRNEPQLEIAWTVTLFLYLKFVDTISCADDACCPK